MNKLKQEAKALYKTLNGVELEESILDPYSDIDLLNLISSLKTKLNLFGKSINFGPIPKPVIVIGLPSIRDLLQGKTLITQEAYLMPSSTLLNECKIETATINTNENQQ